MRGSAVEIQDFQAESRALIKTVSSTKGLVFERHVIGDIANQDVV